MKSLLGILIGFAMSSAFGAETITVAGSGTVATAIETAVRKFTETTGIRVELIPLPSMHGIFGVAEGKTDIGLTIVPVSDAQKQLYPKVDFQSTTVGRGAIYLLVSPDIWEAGVRALSREQVLGVVEKKIVDWKDLGGTPGLITFFPPGAGSLTNVATWLIGKPSLEFENKLREMGLVEKSFAYQISNTRGALGALSERFRPGETLARKLAIATKEGLIEPSNPNISSGKYPISFDLRLITNGPAVGNAKELLKFLLSDAGQAFIEAEGYARILAGVQRTSK